VTLGGGEVFRLAAGGDVTAGVHELPPAGCPGPYWIVGEYRIEE